MMAAKTKGAVRAARFQVGDVRGERKEVFARWRAVADLCSVAVNMMFQTWLVWHVEHKTADVIRQMRIDWVAYKEKKGPKPPKIDPFPKELSKLMYDNVTQGVTGVNSQVLAQLMQAERQRFLMKPATKGAWSYWQQVLLCRERLPQFTRELPIPIKRSAYELVLPDGPKDEYAIVSRVNRTLNDKGRAISVEDRIELVTNRKNAWKQRLLLDRIASGEYVRCGAQLAWDNKKKRWFGIISYRIPKADSKVSAEKTATLMPQEDRPWDLVTDGHTYRIGGDGRHVTAVRQRVMRQRRARQHGYRYAGSANKGHGRKRAIGPAVVLEQRWKDFVKTCNHHTTATVLRILIDDGIGNLIYHQPTGELRDKMFLTNAGRSERDHSGWQWFQVASHLAYKCQLHGIKVTVKKQDGKELEAEDAA